METIKKFIKWARVDAVEAVEVFPNRIAVQAARQRFRRISLREGGGSNPYLLTTQDASAKLAHNADFTNVWEQVIMYLSPHRESGVLNVCPWSTAKCREDCLSSAGRLGLAPADVAKRVRTMFLAEYPYYFIILLMHEISVHAKRMPQGKRLLVRLNGTSDIPWEEFVPELFAYWAVHDVWFQDYTKDAMSNGEFTRWAVNTPLEFQQKMAPMTWVLPNYYLVRSVTERTSDVMIRHYPENVVVVVNVRKGEPLPKRWNGRIVVDGDEHDMRMLDPQGRRAVLVRAKGSAVGKENGFVKSV